jgi:hypothetical protein
MHETAAIEIRDIYLASFLFATDAHFLSYDRSDPKHPRFFFARTDRLDYLVKLYWSGRATQIPACKLFECYRHLQTLIAPQP